MEQEGKSPTTFLLAFGGNLGDVHATFKAALELLHESAGKVLRCSPWYRTKAMTLDSKEQNDYINGMVLVESFLSPEEMLSATQSIEKKLGRDRTSDERWQPRTIDIDIIFAGDKVIDSATLTVPHPELQKRDFVLVPLNDIAPDFIHPKLIKSAQELLAELSGKRFVIREDD